MTHSIEGQDELLLSERHRKLLIDLLAIHVPEARVWAYGSRVSGSAHEGSDLDIVLLHKTTREVAVDGKHELIDAIEQSLLPMLIDVSEWCYLPEWLRGEIEYRHVVLREPD
jgi:predicted nucleotidyltransferase